MYSTYRAAKTGQSPIQDTTATEIWFSENGMIAFATTLDWNGVKALYAGFSKTTCLNLGKVKDVTSKKSMVQVPFDQYVSNSSHACKVTVHMHTHAQIFASHTHHHHKAVARHIQGSVQDKILHGQVVHV